MSGSTSMAEVSSTRDTSACFFWLRYIPVVCGLLALITVGMSLDIRYDLEFSAAGPGLTFDEGFNVETGVYLVESVLAYGVAAVHPATLMEICDDPAYNADHPPFGRLVLGATHALLHRLWGDSHSAERGYVISYARFGSAFLFAVSVWWASWMAQRWFGNWASAVTGLTLLLTPRLFAHAHLASLETAMGLTYLATVLWAGERWSGREKLTWREGVLLGVFLGLAFLTKMQATLLPPVLLAWGLWHWKWRALPALIATGAMAFLVFLLGWPWLWLDPLAHLQEYFLRATERQVVYCQYFGERFADRDVPWHYPWMIFLVTTPLAILLLGLAGGVLPSPSAGGTTPVSTRRRQRLLVLSTLAPLVLFSVPGIAVYDGERLFLVAWLPFSLLAGQGAEALTAILTHFPRIERAGKRAFVLAGFVVVLLMAFTQTLLHPCQLAYYNLLLGGTSGAARWGMELSYWGDGVTGPFLDDALTHLPEGATLDVAPVLHPLQLEFMRTQQVIDRPDLVLRGFDVSHLAEVQYLLVIHRQADRWEILKAPPADWTLVTQLSRQGAPTASLYKLTR